MTCWRHLVDDLQFLPWHMEERARLARLVETDRLPHALLLSGPPYLGKRNFAAAFAGYLLCRNRGDARCGQCEDCKLLNVGTHPDFRTVAPEDSRLIKIEQIRDLNEWGSQTAQRSGYKVVVIHPAEQMNLNAANALLKSLEEPGRNTLMMLVSDLPGRLLATIRSRCQHVDFTIPEASVALAWLGQQDSVSGDLSLLLGIAGGSPLAVTEQFDDAFLARRKETAKAIRSLLATNNPLAVAQAFTKGDPGVDLAIIYSLFADALRMKLAGHQNAMKNSDLADVITEIDSRLDVPSLFSILDAIARDRRDAAGPSNPNIPLLFEGLMVEIAGYCAL